LQVTSDGSASVPETVPRTYREGGTHEAQGQGCGAAVLWLAKAGRQKERGREHEADRLLAWPPFLLPIDDSVQY